MSIALTIVRLAKLVEIALTSTGLTVNQYRMLTFIEDGTPSIREISQRLAMKPPNVSTLVDGLVGRGLAEKSKDSIDGRRWQLELTTEGLGMLQESERRVAAVLDHVLVSAPDREQLLAGIDNWEPILDQLGANLRAQIDAGADGA